jgi:hypothetical protein
MKHLAEEAGDTEGVCKSRPHLEVPPAQRGGSSSSARVRRSGTIRCSRIRVGDPEQGLFSVKRSRGNGRCGRIISWKPRTSAVSPTDGFSQPSAAPYHNDAGADLEDLSTEGRHVAAADGLGEMEYCADRKRTFESVNTACCNRPGEKSAG